MSEGLEAKVAASDPRPPRRQPCRAATGAREALGALCVQSGNCPRALPDPRTPDCADAAAILGRCAGRHCRRQAAAARMRWQSLLARIWVEHALPLELGQQMIAARHWHIERAAFADISAWLDHIDQKRGQPDVVGRAAARRAGPCRKRPSVPWGAPAVCRTMAASRACLAGCWARARPKGRRWRGNGASGAGGAGTGTPAPAPQCPKRRLPALFGGVSGRAGP